MGNGAMRTVWRAVAAVTLIAFVPACTKNEVRPSVEPQHFEIDWERLDAPPVPFGPLELRGIILSPAQWPLEASVKRALRGDFIGIIDGFNLRFESSKIPSGVLEDLYRAGYVPVYLRVANDSNTRSLFSLSSLAIEDRLGARLYAVEPELLPSIIQSIDWKKTGQAVVISLLIVFVILAIASGKGRGGSGGVNLNFGGGGRKAVNDPREPPLQNTRAKSTATVIESSNADNALLRSEVLPAHTFQEGLVLFKLSDAILVDWTTARLVPQ